MINADQAPGVADIVALRLHRRVCKIIFDALEDMPERIPVEWHMGGGIPRGVLVIAHYLRGREERVHGDVP
eukprot:16434420-Heterocapsa_arctica.AAC.1